MIYLLTHRIERSPLLMADNNYFKNKSRQNLQGQGSIESFFMIVNNTPRSLREYMVSNNKSVFQQILT